MTEVLHFPSSPSASSPSSPSSSASRSNATLLISSDHRRRNPVPGFAQDVVFHGSMEQQQQQLQDLRRSVDDDGSGDGEDQQISLLALLVAIFRRSLVSCKSNRRDLCSMEIGWPTNVRHVAHVTFDRFDGFLGLPVEFKPEVPRRAPSARNILILANMD